MIMCVLLCYPVSIRIYYQQGGLFLVTLALEALEVTKICLTINHFPKQQLIVSPARSGDTMDSSSSSSSC